MKVWGGEITIKSEGFGFGSTFSLTLPVFYNDKLLEEKEIEKRTFSPRVLVVEDCKIISDAIKHALSGIVTIPITVVTSGEEAIKNFNDRPYDLILMDTNLETAMTGIDVTGEIRKHPINKSAQRPIIISVSGDLLTDKELKDYGMDGRCPKPIFAKHMKALFNKYFEKIE